MKYIIVFIFSIISLIINAQSYKVESFQDEYQEIEEFKSLMLELEGDLFWYHTFDLNFTFPFFDLEYTYLNGNYRGVFGFDDEIEYSMDLLSFGYQPDNVLDTSNITSDVRYKFTEINGKKCLVVQYTKNRLISDTSIDEFDSHVNFQYWFFEDGTIEIRMGSSNLENCPLYVAGDGLYLLTNQGFIPVGPFLGLTHPLQPHIIINYNDVDSLHNFEIIDNWQNGSINWWPPEGWVIRFTNLLVSTNDNSIQDNVHLYPNPTAEKISISSDDPIKSASLYNINGTQIMQMKSEQIKEMDFSTFPPGTYFLRLYTDNHVITKKLIKI